MHPFETLTSETSSQEQKKPRFLCILITLLSLTIYGSYFMMYENDKILDPTPVGGQYRSHNFDDSTSKSEIEALVTVSPGNRDVSNEVVSQHWPDDKECSKFLTRFGKNLPLTYLASFPRSGNTWTRYLIEGATGILTGSVYNDKRLRKEFPGVHEKWNSRRVIVVKIHPSLNTYHSFISAHEGSVIFIIRNPYKSIASLWDFIIANNRGENVFKFFADSSSYMTPGFKKYASKTIKEWEKSCLDVISLTKKLHVVFYEDLKNDPVKELRKILKFLRMRPDENRLACTEKHLEGYAKRKHGGEIQPYDKALEMQLKRAIFKVTNALKLKGIEVPKEYKLLINNQTKYKL